MMFMYVNIINKKHMTRMYITGLFIALLFLHNSDSVLITQRRDKIILITQSQHEDIVHQFSNDDYPPFSFNITANSGCAMEPPGIWHACSKNGDMWRMFIEIPNINNDVDAFNSYWITWTQNVGGRISTYSAKDSMDSIKRIGSIESRENTTVIKVVSSAPGKVILGCGSEGLDLRDIHTYDLPDDRLTEYKM